MDSRQKHAGMTDLIFPVNGYRHSIINLLKLMLNVSEKIEYPSMAGYFY